jgi:hypothetical protein
MAGKAVPVLSQKILHAPPRWVDDASSTHSAANAHGMQFDAVAAASEAPELN